MKDKHELRTFAGAIISLAVSRFIPRGGQKLIYRKGQKFRTDKRAARDDTPRRCNYCFLSGSNLRRTKFQDVMCRPKEPREASQKLDQTPI